MATISGLYRYPVKGLRAEQLDAAELVPGDGIPGDRAYAIETGSGLFDPVHPEPLPKTNFLMLMRHETLAALDTKLDPRMNTLSITHSDGDPIRASLDSREGRAAITAYFSDYLDSTGAYALKVVSAAGHAFSDCGEKCVSIINLASVRELEKIMKVNIDPLRFRANFYVEGWDPWEEFELIDRRINAGGAQLHVTKRIDRCAATNVDPSTGLRDLNIPAALRSHYGHIDMGIYAGVARQGGVAAGDSIAVD